MVATRFHPLPPQVDPSDADGYSRMVELWFLFCLLWSVCASVDEDGRKVIDSFIREMEGQFPSKVWLCTYFGCSVDTTCVCVGVDVQDTVYEYYVDVKSKTWVHWEEKLKGAWRYPNK